MFTVSFSKHSRSTWRTYENKDWRIEEKKETTTFLCNTESPPLYISSEKQSHKKDLVKTAIPQKHRNVSSIFFFLLPKDDFPSSFSPTAHRKGQNMVEQNHDIKLKTFECIPKIKSIKFDLRNSVVTIFFFRFIRSFI